MHDERPAVMTIATAMRMILWIDFIRGKMRMRGEARRAGLLISPGDAGEK